MKRSHVLPLLAGVGLALVAAVACTKEQLKAEATTAKAELINCTAQELGTVPALDLATLVAVANVVAAERAKCTPAGGSLDWSCVKADLVAEGKTLGGCALVRLVNDATGKSPEFALSGNLAPNPGRAALDEFRAKVAPGVVLTYHTAAGDL